MAKKAKKDIYLNNPNLPAVGATFEFTPEMVADLKRCKEDIIYFAENFFYIINPDTGKQKIPLYEYQKTALQMMKDNRFTMLLFSRQTGKALDVDTPIPTPNGFVRMGDLKAGDEVYDENGKAIKVLFAHDIMYDRDCYEVVFDNGEKIVADGEHLWSVDSGVITTEQLKINNFTVSHCNVIDGMVKPAEDCRYIRKHTVLAINKVKSRPVRCITVDSPTSLYLAGKTCIPTHNSTISTILCLWHACFRDDQTIIIVANKEATAKAIFKRMRMAYEMLPNWLKPACKEYGKESMELANGSHVSITTTTGTAGRGSTANVLFIDEVDWIEPNMLSEFWASVYPIISASRKAKIVMASTPRDTSGLFYKLYQSSLLPKSAWKSMKITWDQVPGRDEQWRQDTIQSLSDPSTFSREFECVTGDTVIDIENATVNTIEQVYNSL